MNNKYIKKQEYKYIVIPEKRMVICECTPAVKWWDLKNKIYNDVPTNWDKNVEPVFKNDNYPVFTVRAVAKAHPDDIFDETKGKRIAKSKANIKVYHKIRKCLNEMHLAILSKQKHLTEHYKDLTILMKTEIEHLDNLKK